MRDSKEGRGTEPTYQGQGGERGWGLESKISPEPDFATWDCDFSVYKEPSGLASCG